MAEKLEKKGFKVISIHYQVACENGHIMNIKENEVENIECETCENERKINPILEKIKKEEDITLKEFKKLIECKDIELDGTLYHRCHKCTSYLTHVHYNDKCFYRYSTQRVYSIFGDDEDWDEQTISDTCGRGCINEYEYVDVEPYDLDEIIS